MSLLNTTLKDDVHASRLKIDAVEVCIYILNCLLVIRINSLYYFSSLKNHTGGRTE